MMTAPSGAFAAPWLDRAADGRILRWEPHFLSREMAGCGSVWLTAEPSFQQAAAVADQVIEARPIDGGVELVTKGWAWLRAAAWPPVASDTTAGGDRDLRPPPRTMLWSDPPFADGFDLTPFDAHDRPGATVRVRRPPLQPYLPFRFHYHYGAPHDRISCRPLRDQAATAWFEPLFLLTLKLAGPARFEPGRDGGELAAGAGECATPHDFRGLVAVVGTRDARRYLLDCRSVFEQRLSSSAPEALAEWRAASRLLRCEWPGEQVWPRRSHDRLAALRDAAANAGLPPDQAELRPRGVLRWLVLRACGAAPRASESAVVELNESRDLAALLAARRPRAFALVAGITDPRARLWIFNRDSLPDLADIVHLAGDGDEPTFRAAAALLPVKKRWDDLLKKVRPDGSLAGLARQRIKQIEVALRSRAPLGTFAAGLAAAEDVLMRESAPPPRAGEPPPEGRQRHLDWLALTGLARAWRRRVAAILAFCESGSWLAVLPPATDGTGDLLRRARRLAEPPALDEIGDPADLAKLQASGEQVLHDADHEPDSGERQGILDALDARVRTCPERWAAFHAALRRAGTLARTWPGLAAHLGLAADGSGDRARVVLFLRLAADLRQQLDAPLWSDPPHGAGRWALGDLMAAPGDPRIAAAHAEAAGLSRRLAGTPGLPILQPAPPPRPAADARQEFLSWWRQLRALDATLGQLRNLARDQERWARRAGDLARLRLAAGGIAAGAAASRLAPLLAADPASLTHAEVEELRAAASHQEK